MKRPLEIRCRNVRHRGGAGCIAATGPIKLDGEVATRNGVALWDFSQPAPKETAATTEKLDAQVTPATELRRAKLLQELRESYARACKEFMGLEQPPADSVDRWLLEQLAQERRAGHDPLLARPKIAECSRVLLRELLAEVPMRCPTRAFGHYAREALVRYRDTAERWLERLGAQAEGLRASVEELGIWLKQQGNGAVGRGGGRRPRPEDCQFKRRLQELAQDGGLSSRFRPLVEPAALKVIGVVSAQAQSMAAQLVGPPLETEGIYEDCVVELRDAPATNSFSLHFRGDSLSVSALHFRKLSALYQVQSGPRPGPADTPGSAEAWDRDFQRRLYMMLRRYVTFIGLDPDGKDLVGGNMHAAAPEPVFAWLKEELGVRCECFASPLNCYFSRFFSAFPDVDNAFGSQGSFFDATGIHEGSFEVGPPYTEEVIDLTAQKLLKILRQSCAGPLSFVVFVPDWEGAAGLNLLGGPEFASFRRTHHGASYLLAKGKEHHYVSGIQFFADAGEDTSKRYYVVPHGTRVYVLQNDAGAEKWPFTEARERALLERMRP